MAEKDTRPRFPMSDIDVIRSIHRQIFGDPFSDARLGEVDALPPLRESIEAGRGFRPPTTGEKLWQLTSAPMRGTRGAIVAALQTPSIGLEKALYRGAEAQKYEWRPEDKKEMWADVMSATFADPRAIVPILGGQKYARAFSFLKRGIPKKPVVEAAKLAGREYRSVLSRQLKTVAADPDNKRKIITALREISVAAKTRKEMVAGLAKIRKYNLSVEKHAKSKIRKILAKVFDTERMSRQRVWKSKPKAPTGRFSGHYGRKHAFELKKELRRIGDK